MKFTHWDAALMYFTVSLAVCSFTTFAPVFLQQHWGLKTHQLGFVASMAGVLFLGSLFWGTISDHYRRPRLIAILCTSGYALTMMSLMWMPVVKEWALEWTTTVFAFSNFFLAALFPLVDAEVMRRMHILGSGTHDRSSFGRLRLWGTIGHTLVILASGYARKYGGFRWLFALLLLSCASFILCAIIGLPGQVLNAEEVKQKDSQKTPLWNRLALILKNGRFMAFLAVVMIIGWARALLSFWLNLHLERHLSFSPEQVSWINAIRVLTELGIFYAAKPLTAYLGSRGMLVLCQVAGILRLAAYGWLDLEKNKQAAAWICMAIELLKGVSAASFTASAVQLANYLVTKASPLQINPSAPDQPNSPLINATQIHAPSKNEEDHLRKESRTLAQGCLYGVYNGLSASFAGLSGSAILSHLDPRPDSITVMFQMATWVSIGGLLAYLLAIRQENLNNVR